MNAQIAHTQGAPAQSGHLDAATRTCFRQQERIIALAGELRSIADMTFGPIPSSGGNAPAQPKTPLARIQELGTAQAGIDEAIDLLLHQVERFREL